MTQASTVDLVLARGDDWSGIYRSGVLVHEEHNVAAERLIQEMGHNVFRVVRVRVVHVDQAWLERRGCLPENVTELMVAA